MTNTNFSSFHPPRSASRRANVVLISLILFVLAITGYVTYRLINVKEGEAVDTKPVATTEVRQANLDDPKPTQDDISTWIVPDDHPRFISIDTIGMGKTRVESVGRNANNQIDIPHNIWNAAWFDESALPGVAGAGLYDCHTFFGIGYGLCNNLVNLKNGDKIVVERGDGIKYVYSTVEVKDLSLDEANAYVETLLKVPTGYGATQSISIITCTGNFDMNTQSADRRLTVRAILVG